jgi:hypothetical protein
MLDCPQCGIRQYAAASYLAEPRCVECESPLGYPKSPPPAARRLLARAGGDNPTAAVRPRPLAG